MKFDIRASGNKPTGDRTLMKLLKSPGLMVSASDVTKTIFLRPDPNELCDRFKLLLQEKQAGNNSHKINEQRIAVVDKLLEYKCISRKQHTKLLLNSHLLPK